MSQAALATIAAILEAGDRAHLGPSHADNPVHYVERAKKLFDFASGPFIKQTGDAWKEAIIQACIVNCIDWDESSAEKSLAALLKWEVETALDPRVSERAAALAASGLLDASYTPGRYPLYLKVLYNNAGQKFVRDPLQDKQDSAGNLWTGWRLVTDDYTLSTPVNVPKRFASAEEEARDKQTRKFSDYAPRPTLDDLRKENAQAWEATPEAPTRPRAQREHVHTITSAGPVACLICNPLQVPQRTFVFVYETHKPALRISADAETKEAARALIVQYMEVDESRLREQTDAEAGRQTGPGII